MQVIRHVCSEHRQERRDTHSILPFFIDLTNVCIRVPACVWRSDAVIHGDPEGQSLCPHKA